MEFFYDKKWWQNQVPEDEKEKEYEYNVKREYKKKSEQETEVQCKCTEPMASDQDYWSTVEETDDEAMRRRMIEACRLRKSKLKGSSIYAKAGKVFGAFTVIGLAIVAVYYLVHSKGENIKLFNNKTSNYIDPN